MDLSEDFILNLDKFSLNKLQKDIVLGISGGVDSIVLAHLFIENKIPISLCHINFNLRGEESDQDMGFVSEFAVNSGGVINAYAEHLGNYDKARAESLIENIYNTISDIYDDSSQNSIPTFQIALRHAKERIAIARSQKGN